MCVSAARRWACVCACLLLSQPLHAGVGLWFVRSPEPLIAPPGDEVVFDCSLNLPADQVRWRHGSRFLNNSHTMSRSNRLVVKVNNASEAGDYQCVAGYGASALTSVPASLTLAELRPFAAGEDRLYEVSPGNLVALHCEAPYSQPLATLQYLKEGRKLPAQPAGWPGALVLQNVSAADSGQYSCVATNYLTGQAERMPYVMSVRIASRGREPPSFLATPPLNYTVQPGWNVTLQCSGVGEPPPRTSWTRYGAALPAEHVQVVPGGLALRDVRKADEGTYLCHVGNGVGTNLTHRITLHVQEVPVIARELADTKVEEGGDVTLECEARGSPAPHISWVLNGDSLDDDSRAHISGGRLRLEQVEKRHAGIVQCFASNALGATYSAALLRVVPKQVTSQPEADPFTADTELDVVPSTSTLSGGKGSGRHDSPHKGKGRRKHKGNAVMIPPSRPNITRLTDTSVMVHWSVPPNKGLPIQFFKVQHREITRHRGRNHTKGKNSRWKTSNEDIAPHVCSYEVDGLEPDRTYRFRIAAVYSNNDNKAGQNSARFHLHRGFHLKTAPKLVRTQAVSPTVIQIFWNYSASSSAVDGFYVYYRATSSAGHYVKATVEGQGARSYNITHLVPDTAYDIKIQSFTIGGASDFSAILAHKTLSSPTERPEVVMVGGVGSAEPQASSGQLVMVVGAACGGLLLLTALLLLAVFLHRHRKSASTSQSAEHDSQHDKLDPERNGDVVPVESEQ